MKNILLTSLLLGVNLLMGKVVNQPVLIQDTSLGKYAKEGAPVDISYTTQQVKAGQFSQIKINLLTHVPTGEMKVKINVDTHLKQKTTIASQAFFRLDNNKNRYPLTFEVSSDMDGLYYIKLIVEIKGKGFRVFAIPIYIGQGKAHFNNKAVQKTTLGEKISISPAIESIIRK